MRNLTFIFSVLITIGFYSCKPTQQSTGSKYNRKSNKKEVKSTKVLNKAYEYMGTPHRLGGTTKRGIDCSGLVYVSYQSVKIALPRNTSGLYKTGRRIRMNELQTGDLLFFRQPKGKKITHVGLVSKINNKNSVIFIHASSSKGVREDDLFSDYWKKYFVSARRVL
ncbi:C40 family peptidase [Rapidithrix thailandica]|uniref:C40 family peptidase n=1 Tax=Rapidithrix thailandica TaxID=413964 RepID=A0AAW9SDB2_9BACT